MPALATITAVVWHDASDAYWGHPRKSHEEAWRASYGPVTLTVYRDTLWRFGCRCALFGQMVLPVARNEVEARELAVELLRAAVDMANEALNGSER